MRVFAPAACTYNGISYPYGWQHINDDSLAHAMNEARLVFLDQPRQPPAVELADHLAKNNALGVPQVVNDPVTGKVTNLTAGGRDVVADLGLGSSGAPVPLTSNRNLAAVGDSGKTLEADAGRTVTILPGMSAFSCEIILFSGTTLTIVGAAGVTVNGVVGATVTRTQAANPIISIIQRVGTDNFLVTGV